ncbi:PAS domain-containing protein [Rhodovastum atsumiense]|uniref:PAS domain-containing protein n=1 Tax=Rhodovastum atsumiense TaxID=504468 RepID=A0A5M6ITL3_9PROT|nr:hypothetical protein [Rhodovastum atsumiense]KAA5611167.1 hypothetical protein F1189_15465 [Rhodovastum atsumiense]CAH2602527.1 PAS domain-containing protein [Rhodovastum atsumiense]
MGSRPLTFPPFDDARLLDWLQEADGDKADRLPFGIIAMDHDGYVELYNAYEAKASGFTRERAIGRNFFRTFGRCTNNPLVAGRLLGNADIDDTIHHTFTFRMKVVPVRLRLLKRLPLARMALAVDQGA